MMGWVDRGMVWTTDLPTCPAKKGMKCSAQHQAEWKEPCTKTSGGRFALALVGLLAPPKRPDSKASKGFCCLPLLLLLLAAVGVVGPALSTSMVSPVGSWTTERVTVWGYLLYVGSRRPNQSIRGSIWGLNMPLPCTDLPAEQGQMWPTSCGATHGGCWWVVGVVRAVVVAAGPAAAAAAAAPALVGGRPPAASMPRRGPRAAPAGAGGDGGGGCVVGCVGECIMYMWCVDPCPTPCVAWLKLWV